MSGFAVGMIFLGLLTLFIVCAVSGYVGVPG